LASGRPEFTIGSIAKHHTFGEFHSLALLAEIRDLRCFVQFRPDSVSYKLANYAEAVCFNVFLYR